MYCYTEKNGEYTENHRDEKINYLYFLDSLVIFYNYYKSIFNDDLAKHSVNLAELNQHLSELNQHLVEFNDDLAEFNGYLAEFNKD